MLTSTPYTLLRVNFLFLSQVVRIGLPSTLLVVIRSRADAVGRITLDPSSKGMKVVEAKCSCV